MERYETCEDLLARLDALSPAPGSWAATDADGTLWDTDLADQAWRRVIAGQLLRPASHEPLRGIARAAGVPAGDGVYAELEELYARYLTGRVGDDPILMAMTLCYAGWEEDEVRAFAREVFAESVGPEAFVTTRPLLEGLRARGLQLVVCSGSPRLLVEEAVGGLLGETPRVLGTGLEREGSRLLGRMREPITWGPGKRVALEASLGPDARVACAFGDSLGDLALLEMAALIVLVHPRPSLRAACADKQQACVFAPTHTVDGQRVRPPTSDVLLAPKDEE